MTERGTCPDCRNEVAVKRDGFLRTHGYQHGRSTDTICDGSGKPPMRRASVRAKRTRVMHGARFRKVTP